MASIGELELIIGADATALTAVIKDTTRTVTSLLDSMNSQSIDWEKILTGTISPAIIGGIASMMAIGIEQALNFQDAMTTAANNSSTAFQDGMGNASSSVLGISNATGQSASDVATNTGLAATALGSMAAGTALVSQAAILANAGIGDLGTNVSELIPVMKEWGITDAGQIVTTITELAGVAHQGQVPLSQLLDAMSNTGGVLQGKTDILSAASSLEAYSNQAGMTANTAVISFTKIANNLQNTATASQNTVIGMGSYNNQLTILKNLGIDGLLAKMESSLEKMGPSTASILLNNAGFSPTDTANIQKAAKSYSDLVPSTQTIAANALTMGTNIETNISDLQKLQDAWNKVKNDLNSAVGGPLITMLTNALTLVDKLATSTAGLAGSNSSDNVSTNLESAAVNESQGEEMTRIMDAYQTAKNAGDKARAAKILAIAQSFMNSEAGTLSSITGGATSIPPPAPTPSGSTINNVTNYNISSNSVNSTNGGAGSLSTSAYNSSQGINLKNY